MDTFSLTICDDDKITHEVVAKYLLKFYKKRNVELQLQHFYNAKTLLSHAEDQQTVLMDIDMPYLSGIEATAMVKEAYPQIEVMMLTVFEERNKIFDALHAGATGYLLKKSSAIQIIEGITELVNGGSPTSGEIARKVLDFFTATGNHEETFHSLRSGVGGTPAIDSGRQLQDDRRTAPLHRYGSVSINTSTVN